MRVHHHVAVSQVDRAQGWRFVTALHDLGAKFIDELVQGGKLTSDRNTTPTSMQRPVQMAEEHMFYFAKDHFSQLKPAF